MQSPIHRRGRRFGTLDSVPRALLFAAAMMIGCGFAMAAIAADDKAKPNVETPSKATVDAPATGTVLAPEADAPRAKTDSETTPGKRSPRRRSHIKTGDDDFDSFNEALQTAPWVVGLAFVVAGSILLTPVFLLIGIIWYKLRKTRLQNETVLKLAERGAMAPAHAVDAVMSGVTPEAAMASSAEPLAPAASGAPVYQQTVIARRRAVWSDLRKGVILTAIGLSFVFYWMVESGSASWVGLVLMFLGLGYLLLWWFEDRHLQRHETGADADVNVGKS
ncbi:MAG TPA: hypothetical protein VN326_01315 [Casimicrobiaceae bacterium]|nr:hypothetical protein [Casimicrobiaceae bacterium]